MEGFKMDSEIANARQKQSIEMMSQTMDVLSNKETRSKDDYKIILNMQKEMHHSELEWFHSKVDMIRKFSPKSADELDKEIVELEKSYRNIDTCFDDFIKEPISNYPLELIQYMEKDTNNFLSLDKKVRLCENCIKGTLEKVSDLKNN